MRTKRTKVIAPVDIVADMADLLDLAGIDGVDRSHVEHILHQDINPQSLLDYAEYLHRQQRKRIDYRTMIAGFMGEKQ